MTRWHRRLLEPLRADSELWRRALSAGVTFGPESFVRYSPPVFGVAFGAALHEQRTSVRNALRLVFGRRPALDELRDVAAVFSNFACCLTDAMLVGSGRGYAATSRALDHWNLLSTVAEGRGVIVATAQTAGWDLGGALLTAVQDREVVVVMDHERDAAAQSVHDAARRRAGIDVVHVGSDPLASLHLLQHLTRRGGVVALKFDRVRPGMRTRSVRFFSQPWAVPEGPLRLASLSGAPIVPVFSRRLGFLEYQLFNMEPITLGRSASDAELDAAAQRLANALEAFVRAYPTQWFRFTER